MKEKTREFTEGNKILDGIGDLLFVMDKNRIIMRVNKSTCDALKKEPEDLIGKHCYEVLNGNGCCLLELPSKKDF